MSSNEDYAEKYEEGQGRGRGRGRGRGGRKQSRDKKRKCDDKGRGRGGKGDRRTTPRTSALMVEPLGLAVCPRMESVQVTAEGDHLTPCVRSPPDPEDLRTITSMNDISGR
eukprot:587575-Amphidinium_carterae.2